MCFVREVILANGVERRLAIAYASTIDIIKRRCLAIWVRHLTNCWVHFESPVELEGQTV